MISARLGGMAQTASFSAVMDVRVKHVINQMGPVSVEVRGQGIAVIAVLLGDMEQNASSNAALVVSANSATTPQGSASVNKAGKENFVIVYALNFV